MYPRIDRGFGVTVLATGILGALATSVPATDVEFHDETFPDAQWTLVKLIDTTEGALVSAERVETGGNPGDYRETTHVYRATDLHVAHTKDDAVYDPSESGPIGTVDVLYDVKHDPVSGWGVRYRPMLVQDGIYYSCECGDAVFDAVWQSAVHVALTATDFTPIEAVESPGPAYPDFSEAGAPITFGYETSNHATAHDPQTRVHGIDNWRVVVHAPVVGIADAPSAPARVIVRPNPFRSRIAVVVPGAPRAGRISIYDVAGRLVGSTPIVDGTAVWSGRDASGQAVSPGVYVLRAVGADDRPLWHRRVVRLE